MATASIQERARIMGKFTVSLKCPAYLQYGRIAPAMCQEEPDVSAIFS
jgi:hypothetical protein